jgi:hypothetical protein
MQKPRVYFKKEFYRWWVDMPDGSRGFFWEWGNAIRYALQDPCFTAFVHLHRPVRECAPAQNEGRLNAR